ncbi:hypothetical protein [Pseudobacteriovorax antillogorgiicola]|uniref:Solute-binding protein family 3/N-terminal domain-containing protein n=1 Tax=Pseudobacteriovorax antillogorgiicola TaxID=1513793 RepID=A0A1Y6BG26_9BACT|nr:hypothetical protein [Pseudobacteriovorax antillogorgiicola]TCS57577.1 hypothetical protein EDD56_103317 [Pseudobacteriovorax antillogorgiicola]SME99635.1 hypothetical protein SAMN06296036_10316 [Pseudobacteriovorax antillogorgiicola]
MKLKIYTILLLNLIASLPSFGETLGVFTSSMTQARQLKRNLRQDPLLKDHRILVFSRQRDFDRAAKFEKFDFTILPSRYPVRSDQYEALFQLTRQGAATFRYQIITLEERWRDIKSSPPILGAFDELGRRNMNQFAKSIFPKYQFKRIKLSGKLKDLYPMLALGNVEVIMIDPQVLETIRKDSKATPILIDQSEPVALPKIFVKKGHKSPLNTTLANLKKATLQALGVDDLKRITSEGGTSR